MSDLVKRLNNVGIVICDEAADALESYKAKLKVAVEALEHYTTIILGDTGPEVAREALARIKEGK